MTDELNLAKNILYYKRFTINILSFIPYLLFFAVFIFGKHQKTYVTYLNLQLSIMCTIRTITFFLLFGSNQSQALCMIQAYFTLFPDFSIQSFLTYISVIAHYYMFSPLTISQRMKCFKIIGIIIGYVLPIGLGLFFTFLGDVLPGKYDEFCWISNGRSLYIYVGIYFLLIFVNFFFILKNICGVKNFAKNANVDCFIFDRKLKAYLCLICLIFFVECLGFLLTYFDENNLNGYHYINLAYLIIESLYLPGIVLIYGYTLQTKEAIKSFFHQQQSSYNDSFSSNEEEGQTLTEFRNSYI